MSAPNFIFESSAIRIVEYKWINAQSLVWVHALPYQLQSVIIIIDTWFLREDRRLKWVLMTINLLLLIKFLFKFYFFVVFKNRRECSYHIEYEDNNRVK